MPDPLKPFRSKFGTYLGLTTYKRDGTGVTTPTWYVPTDDRILMRTDATAWKVKRMRNNPSVQIAPADGRGKIKGEALPAQARELSKEEGRAVVRGLVRRYPVGFIFEVAVLRPLYAVTSKFGVGKRRGEPIFFEIVPEAVPQAVDDEAEAARSYTFGAPLAGLLDSAAAPLEMLPVVPL